MKNRKVMKCRFFCLHIICDGCFFLCGLARYVLYVRYNVLFIYLLPYHSNADALGRCFFFVFPFNIENAHLSCPINLIFMFVFLFAFFPAQHFRWLSWKSCANKFCLLRMITISWPFPGVSRVEQFVSSCGNIEKWALFSDTLEIGLRAKNKNALFLSLNLWYIGWMTVHRTFNLKNRIF